MKSVVREVKSEKWISKKWIYKNKFPKVNLEKLNFEKWNLKSEFCKVNFENHILKSELKDKQIKLGLLPLKKYILKTHFARSKALVKVYKDNQKWNR